jgi:signal-transduction protein with cAMP-binding, CBS, and nucleotidyltransferase domain
MTGTEGASTATPVVWTTSPVGRLAARPAVGIAGAASLGAAAALMREESVSSVLVDGGRAIITERDIARAFEAGWDRESNVSEAATPNPLRVPASLPILAASATMLNEDVRHLLVDRGDGTIGVVSLRDVVAVLLQAADPNTWLTALRTSVETTEIWLG